MFFLDVIKNRNTVEKRKESMATRFEPTKSGDYLVEYRVGGYHYYKEKIHYDRKTEQWIGSKPPAFYKKYITSWYY